MSIKKFNLTKEQLEELISQGLSQNDIATRHGVSRKIVSKSLNRYGLKTNPVNKYLDPDFANRQKAIFASDEHRAKISKAIKDKWDDSTYRLKLETVKASDEYLDNLSKSAKERFTDDNYYNAWRDGVELSRDKHKTAVNTEEYKTKISEIVKDRLSDLDYYNKMKSLWSSETHRAKISIGLKTAYAAGKYNDTINTHRLLSPKTYTKPHKKVKAILDAMGVDSILEHHIAFYHFDIFIPSHNILIDIQGNYWHGLTEQVTRDKARRTYISSHHSELTYVELWEHECLTDGAIESKLTKLLNLNFKKCDFELKDLKVELVASADIDAVNEFLYNWHYQSNGRSGHNIVAKLNDEIIAVAKFTTPHRQEIATSIGAEFSNTLELSRFCIKPTHQKRNLATWLLARTYNLLPCNITHIVSFADSGQGHHGTIYKAANWEHVSDTKESYRYRHIETGKHMHKKTLWDAASKMRMSEKEYAEKYGYERLEEDIKHKYVYYCKK